jgi:predicted amino acid dehydrogenase
MAIKLIMTWNISPEREQEYFEFVVRDFIPGVQRLGVDLTDAWATVYGAHPQILVGAILPSQKQAKTLLKSDDWKNLNNQLREYVRDYAEKVVEVRGGFQF